MDDFGHFPRPPYHGLSFISFFVSTFFSFLLRLLSFYLHGFYGWMSGIPPPFFFFYFPSERYMTIGLYHCLVDYLDFVLFMPVYILTLRRRFFLLFFHVGIPLPKFPDDAFIPLGLHYMRRFYASFPTHFSSLAYTGPHVDASMMRYSSFLPFFSSAT